MESSMKTRNDQEKKKMGLKVGVGGGGGIGAVVLLGGALATAALASAFVARKKERSSGENRRRRHRSPHPEINQRNERHEEKKGQEFVLPDQPSHLHENPRSANLCGNPSEATKDVEADNDDGFLISTQNSTQVEKPSVEKINGENMKLQKDAIFDGSTIIKEDFPSSDEKKLFEPRNMMDEDDECKIQLTKEVIIRNERSKESQENIEQVCVGENEHSDDGGEKEEMTHDEAIEIANDIQPREEENIVASYDQEKIEETVVEDNALEGVHSGGMEKEELGGFCSNDGEIIEERCSVEAIDGTKADLGATGLELSEDDICQNQETGQKTILPNGHIIEHKSAFSTEIGAIVNDDEAMEGSQEDGVEFIEDNKLVEEEQEKCDQANEETDDLIDVKVEKISYEENDCLIHPSAETEQHGLAMLKEDAIPSENIEVTKEDDPNEEVAESLEMNQDGNALKRKVEVTKEVISPEDIEVMKEYGPNEEVSESLEMNQGESTVQFTVGHSNDENAPGGNVENEAVEELIISPENIEVTKEDGPNEEVAESLEMNEDESIVQLAAHQPKDENALERKVEDTNEDCPKEEVAEILEMNRDESTVQFVTGQVNDENAPGGNVENEVEEQLIISLENTEVTKEEATNKEISESLEMNQDVSNVQFTVCQPNDENASRRNFKNEVEEELIIYPENTEVTKEEVANEEIGEILEMKQDEITVEFAVHLPNDENARGGNVGDEVEEELIIIPNEVNKELLISPGDIEVTKENCPSEEVSRSLELNQEASIEVSACQPKEHEEVLERNNEMETEEELISTEKNTNEVTKEEIAENLDEVKDDMTMEMSGDDEEEKGKDDDDIKDFNDGNDSIETVDSSTESELDAVWPAESLQKTQEVKLIDQELEGKIQEDKTIKGDDYDGQIIGEDYSSFGKGKLEKISFKKYVIKMCNQSYLTRQKLVIGILSVVSSVSCSWFFDLSFVKLSLIVFLTMAIVINGY